MNRMTTTLGRTACLGLGALALAACESEPAPEPVTPSTDAPRSIFEGDEAEDADQDRAQQTLPPLETTLGFPDGTADLTEAARAELATVLGSAQFAAGGRIILRGHSDSDGSDTANLEASLARAEAVRDFLIENDVSEDRIEVIAFGEQNPIEPNALPDGTPNESGRAVNRRVELVVETEGGQVDDDREPTLIEAISEGRTATGEETEPSGE